jgi:hypothetical protein
MRLVAACLFFAVGLAEAAEGLLPLRFTAGSLEFGATRVSDLSVSLATDGRFRVGARRLQDAGTELELVGLELAGWIDEFEQDGSGLAVAGRARYEELPFDFRFDAAGPRSTLCLRAQAPALGALVARKGGPGAAAWIRSGALDACVRQDEGGADGGGGASVAAQLSLQDLAFDSPEGRYAAEGLGIEVRGELPGGSPGDASVSGRVHAGAVLFDHLYAEFAASPLRFELRPQFDAERLAALAFDLVDDGALAVGGRFEWRDGDAWSVKIQDLSLEFPAAYVRYLEAMAATWSLDGLEVTGGLRWAGALGAEGLTSGDLDLLDLTVVDTRRGRFALTGLTTRLRPGAPEFDSTLDWRGLLFGRINLGAGRAYLDSSPGTFALSQPLTLDVLGGSLQLQRLAYRLPAANAAQGGSGFELQARADGIELERLAAALGWPAFGGTLGGEIPRVHLENGVLDVDGEIRVDVFGGSIRVKDLAMERPFGVLPSLSANAEISDLDLEQLTGTFEFGSISGRVDGYVRGLRLLDWSPVAFDAWLGTPERQSSSRSISRQAVKHLAAIGGGGATAALAGPVMRLFNNFSYRRLGLGCRLDNHVCEVSGVRAEGEGVLLLEGAGIPKVTVRAYNRRVDWPQMVANLVAVGSGESIRVGEGDGP